MDISSDYRDLFSILNTYKVRYLVVGAYATAFYTEPRFTKDLDIWVDPEIKNAKFLTEALKHFGAPLKGVSLKDFLNENLIYQIGIAPIRVDIMMGLSGLEFGRAWSSRRRSVYAGIPISILGKDELIYTKKRAGREQDLLDVKKLTRRRSSS